MTSAPETSLQETCVLLMLNFKTHLCEKLVCTLTNIDNDDSNNNLIMYILLIVLTIKQ